MSEQTTLDRAIAHYGKKGMKWGVITYNKDSGGSSKKGEKKPKKLPKVTRSPAQKIQARREAIMKEAEALRSMGNSEMADQLIKDFETSLKEPTSSASSGASLKEEEEEEKKGGSGSGGKGKAKKEDEEKEGEEKEGEEKEGDEEKKGSAGAEKKPKAGAAAPKKEDKKKKEAESQKKVAAEFRAAADEAHQTLVGMSNDKKALQVKMAVQKGKIESARAKKDWGTVKTLRSELPGMEKAISDKAAAMEVQSKVAETLSAKAKKWEDMAKKVKHGSATDVVLEHFGVKGMRWGVQKERKKSGKSTAKKVAKKIAPMDVEGMKNDPLNKAAVKVAKKVAPMDVEGMKNDPFVKVGAKVAKAAVTPIGEKGLLKNKKDVLAIRAKVREKLAKRQEKIADDYDQMAGELDGAAKAMSKGSDAKSTAKVKEVRKKFDRDWGFNEDLETASDFKTMADELRKEGQTFRDSSVKNHAKAQEHRDKSAEYWGKKKVKHESATDVVLKHYGVKGMKWGQRKDRSTSSKKAGPSSMSDDELRTAVKRLNLEQQYVSLTSKRGERNRTAMEQGQDEVNKILKNTGKNVAQSMANAIVPAAIGAGTSVVTAGATYVAARMIIKGLYGK